MSKAGIMAMFCFLQDVCIVLARCLRRWCIGKPQKHRSHEGAGSVLVEASSPSSIGTMLFSHLSEDFTPPPLLAVLTY